MYTITIIIKEKVIKFPNLESAQSFVKSEVHRRVASERIQLDQGAALDITPHKLPDNSFTNSYDFSFRQGSVESSVALPNRLSSVKEIAQPQDIATVNGGFFFLADESGGAPRRHALNLALSNGELKSLPVVDRETLIIQNGRFRAQWLRALGIVHLNDAPVTWSGSDTQHESAAKIYSNGNVRILHQADPETGAKRVLDPESRYTPRITNDSLVDVGFHAENGAFSVNDVSRKGGLDILENDFVLRAPRDFDQENGASLQVSTIDSLPIDSLDGALTVGPFLGEGDLSHPINRDLSLGEHPPFIEKRAARVALYLTQQDDIHVRLFDGLPKSGDFEGVTPGEARNIITQEHDVEWGVFLDSGQTSRLYVQHDDKEETYGNRHYLRWPQNNGDAYEWVPDEGRPVGSAIRFHA